MMDQSIDNLSGLSNSAKNTYGKIFRENQPDNFDYQQWLDQCDDPETKLRRAADMLELKLAGLVQFEFESVNIRLSQRRPSHETVEASLHSDESTNESDSKRGKVEMESSSTSPKAAVNNDDDQCPLTMLPPDILAMIIINHIPLVQWPNLELLPPFRPGILDAWRQVRCVNVERDFLIRLQNPFDASSRGKAIAAIKSILQQLVLRSPFLSSLSGIDIPRAEDDGETKSDVAHLLAQFEHLESITMGDVRLLRGTPLEALVEFLETTRSRASLKVLNVHRVHNRPRETSSIENRFETSFLNGLEIRAPLKLEEFAIELQNWPYHTLDKIDASRLTVIRLGKQPIEPDQWANLIERASKLQWIELSFLICHGACNQQRLQANKKLLTALASREHLSTLILGRCGEYNSECTCTYVEREFTQMLKAIGGRGRLRNFEAMRSFYIFWRYGVDMDEVFAALCKYIPSLRSIRLIPSENEPISNIVHLRELEEIDLLDSGPVFTPIIVRYIGQLPRLKRLGLHFVLVGNSDENTNALKCLANATTLIDLRMGNIGEINASVCDKWSNTFAPNLEVLMLDGGISKKGLVRLLKKATRLRILILHMELNNRMLATIAKSCPELEILALSDEHWTDESVESCSEITVQQVQEIVDSCPKLRRLGGLTDEIWEQLKIPNGREIKYDVDIDFWSHSLDTGIYD